MNPLIHGKDPTERIVNITFKNNIVTLYKQRLDGSIETEKIDYSPWVLSKDRIKETSERLKGDNYWKWITPTTCEKFLTLQENFQRDLWLPRSIDETWMLAEGSTLYKGMRVGDVSVLSFDIETSGLVMNSSSKVFLITNTFRNSKGTVTKKTFNVDNFSCHGEMIEAWTNWVREQDPSVICGHNILSYDLPYLQHCSQFPLLLGRDSSEMEISTKISKFRKDGSQQYEYNNIRIAGREIVDTFFLSIKHDQTAREFPAYGLKTIINFLGLEKKDRTFIDAGRIAEYWKDPVMKLNVIKYAEEDSDDALTLFDKFIPAYFYMAQSIPKTLQQMIGEATGSQLDALMIRSYLQDGYSQPRTSIREDFEGAISFGTPGIYDWVAKADVAALYPSVMLQYNIYDKKKDPNRHMLTALEYFRDERLTNKRLFKETGDSYYDGLQASQKILANSIYGFMGSNFLLYNYPDGAAEVTKQGRNILSTAIRYATGYEVHKVVKHIKNAGKPTEEIQYEWTTGMRNGTGLGYELAGVDTDSIWITNGKEITKNQFKSFLVELNNQFPDMINFEDDGVFERFIVLKTKNYIMLKDGELKLKGSGLVDTKKELALREMLKKMFDALVYKKPDEVIKIYNSYVYEAANIQDINRWSVKKTVTQSVLHPDRLTEEKVLNALNEAVAKNVLGGYSEGDKAWFYEALDGMVQIKAKGELQFYKSGEPKMTENRVLRHPGLWKKDENAMHYVERVYDSVQILANIIDMDNIKDYTLKSQKEQLKSLTLGA